MAGDAANWLRPSGLLMPRAAIALPDFMIRLFSGRGAVYARDRTVTGLRGLQFPPIDLPDYRFSLAFRDRASGRTVGDATQDAWEALTAPGGATPVPLHPLGLNILPDGPLTLLLQQSEWQPNSLIRTGTFHKRLAGGWISFAICTKALVAHDCDSVYLTVEITNRADKPLELSVMAQQWTEDVQSPGHRALRHTPLINIKGTRVGVRCDLDGEGPSGWQLDVPRLATRRATFAIVASLAETSRTGRSKVTEADARRATRATARRLASAATRLPEVLTSESEIDSLYRRSILSVLECRWSRPQALVDPFFAVGTWHFTIPWDTSFVASLLTLLDRAGLDRTTELYAATDLFTYSWLPLLGEARPSHYVANLFALHRIVADYIDVVGDERILDRVVGGSETILQRLAHNATRLLDESARPDGLLDFGDSQEHLLELRTDGYAHAIPALNGLAISYLVDVADWCERRGDTRTASLMRRAAGRIRVGIRSTLWNRNHQWPDCLHPDGSRHRVLSYQVFELLGRHVFTARQEAALVRRLRPGEFLGPFGTYSISPTDRIHFDYADADWGGGGQYTGMPFRIADGLFRIGRSELAWSIIRRCARWTSAFPYIPQEVMTDRLEAPEVEQAVELCGGAAAQTLIFGAFGIRAIRGNLEVAPGAGGPSRMALQGLRLQGHTVSVEIDAGFYAVTVDDRSLGRQLIGTRTLVPLG